MKLTQSNTLPQKPIKPAGDDCCGSGNCYDCVWDTYYEERRAWRKLEAEFLAQQDESNSSS